MTDEMSMTVASEAKRLERLRAELTDAQKTQDAAISAMTKRQKDAGMDELLTLADAVRDSKRLCDKAGSAINAAMSNVARLDWEQKAKPLMSAREDLKESVLAGYARVATVFKQFGVERAKLDIDCTGDKAIATLNVTGEAIPKPPATVKRSGGGGGSRGTKVFQTSDGEMGSRDFLTYAQTRSKKSERIDKMLADPDAGRKGLTHLAVEVANELGVTIA